MAGTALIAATYGLVRFAYGLFLPDVQAELGFGAGAAGAISAGGSVVYGAGAAAGFLLAHRRASLLAIAAGLSAGAGAVGMAAAGSLPLFAACAVLSSAGAGLASPALVDILQRNLPPAESERGQAIVNAGTGPGLVAAGSLALTLLPDWRTAWLLAAGITLLAACAVAALDRRRPERGRPAALLPSAPWFAAHARVVVAAFLLGAGSAVVWTYGRVLLTESGVTETVSVVAWMALGAGGAAVIGTAGVMARLGPGIAWSLTSVVLAAATAALVGAIAVPWLAVVACVVFGWAYTAASGALIAWTSEIHPARAATGTALLFIVLVLGQAVGAAAWGLAIDEAGYRTTFLAAAAVAVAAAVLGLRKRRGPVPSDG